MGGLGCHLSLSSFLPLFLILSYLRFALAAASLKSPVTARANAMLIPAPMIPTINSLRWFSNHSLNILSISPPDRYPYYDSSTYCLSAFLSISPHFGQAGRPLPSSIHICHSKAPYTSVMKPHPPPGHWTIMAYSLSVSSCW